MPTNITELLRPFAPGFEFDSGFVWFNWLVLGFCLLLAARAFRASPWNLIRPAAVIAMLTMLIYQAPLALFSGTIARGLPNAWTFALSIHFPVLSGLIWIWFTPSLGVRPASTTQPSPPPELASRATLPAIVISGGLLAWVYLSRLGWECSALFALLNDPELTLLAREFSIKFLGFSHATIAYGALANVVAPVVICVGFLRLQLALSHRRFIGALLWLLLCLAAFLAILLPGAKGMLIHAFVVSGTAIFVISRTHRQRIAALGLAGTVALGMMITLELLKERADSAPARPYDVGHFVRRHGVEQEVRELLESLKLREDSLGISRTRLTRVIASLDPTPTDSAHSAMPESIHAEPTHPAAHSERTPPVAQPSRSLAQWFNASWKNFQMWVSDRASAMRAMGDRVLAVARRGPELPDISKRLARRTLTYVPAVLYRAGVVPLQAASWHFAYVAEFGPPGREALPFAMQLFGRSIDMTSLVYHAYGSVYAAGDKTSTATAPTSFVVAYTAYFGPWGLLMVLAGILGFDVVGTWTLKRSRHLVRAIAAGLIIAVSLNFMVSDLVTTVLSHGGASALGLLGLMIFLEDHPIDGKRLCDILLGAALLVLTLPLMIVVAGAIHDHLGRPIIFRQKRAGHRGRIFHLYKFRTMVDRHDLEGQPLPDELRLTKLGRFLRATSLDELPSLWNLLRGDITLVGPRPLLAEYLPLYTPEQNRRHEVVPGITGWAQVNGRNALDWEDKFRFDAWYVDHRSFGLDIKILLLTLIRVLRRDGINQPGQATAKRFTGNKVPS